MDHKLNLKNIVGGCVLLSLFGMLAGCSGLNKLGDALIDNPKLKPYTFKAKPGQPVAYIRNLNNSDSRLSMKISRQFSRMAVVGNTHCKNPKMFPRDRQYHAVPAGKAITIVTFYEQTFGSEVNGSSNSCDPVAMTFIPQAGKHYSVNVAYNQGVSLYWDACRFGLLDDATHQEVKKTLRRFVDANTMASGDFQYVGPNMITNDGHCPIGHAKHGKYFYAGNYTKPVSRDVTPPPALYIPPSR